MSERPERTCSSAIFRVSAVALVSWALATVMVRSVSADPPLPVSPEITQVPEMARIPLLEAVPGDRPPPMPPVPASFAAAWHAVEDRVQAQLSPTAVCALSRWAKPQMAGYRRTPAVKGAVFKVARAGSDGTLALEATLDTLPSHTPVVTRWLKVIADFDPDRRSIRHVWITIRGQALE